LISLQIKRDIVYAPRKAAVKIEVKLLVSINKARAKGKQLSPKAKQKAALVNLQLKSPMRS
jgi:hypothetical protein